MGGSSTLHGYHILKYKILPPLFFASLFAVFLLLSQPNFAPKWTRFPPFKLQMQMSRPMDGSVQAAMPETYLSVKHPSFGGKRSKLKELEDGLARARAAIRKAGRSKNNSLSKHGEEDLPHNRIFRNAAAFRRSYVEMEKRLKVYVYKEGEPPLVHDGPCKNIYTTEGRFIHQLEMQNTRFRTTDPTAAHVYFMPFSVTKMVTFLYQPLPHNPLPLRRFVSDYIHVISTKYPYWNATAGADHFMLSCHDWGPYASRADPLLYNNSIRVLCNANASEGFDPRKDVSLPEINFLTGKFPPQLIANTDTQNRPFLAFFAGGLHGPIRPILLQHWKNKDKDIQVYEYLPKGEDYYSFMLKSKFCLCPSGFEVASPRIVEAIYAGCVPLIISQNYILPFSEIFRWETFSVNVEISEIARLKEVLMGIGVEEYERLREGLKAVRRYFELNQPPARFDVFHMILHSIWLRRLNIKLI